MEQRGPPGQGLPFTAICLQGYTGRAGPPPRGPLAVPPHSPSFPAKPGGAAPAPTCAGRAVSEFVSKLHLFSEMDDPLHQETRPTAWSAGGLSPSPFLTLVSYSPARSPSGKTAVPALTPGQAGCQPEVQGGLPGPCGHQAPSARTYAAGCLLPAGVTSSARGPTPPRSALRIS